MATNFQPMGPWGILPVPTGMVIGYVKDPATFAYLQYAQFVPAPEVQFMYFKLDPDNNTRLVSLNDNNWQYDDYRPTGKAQNVRGTFITSRVQRYDFPYTLGNTTQRVWSSQGIDPKSLFDRMTASQAALHRASRVVNTLVGATWPSYNTATPQGILGTAAPVYFDQSQGTELLPSGSPNPNYYLIRDTFQKIKRRIHLSTNGVVSSRQGEVIAVLPPIVADAISKAGEIKDALKQSQFAKELIDLNWADWSLPAYYGGCRLVVEDTPRVYINELADGTIADVSVASQKDYIYHTDTITFLSRPGGIDGNYGFKNFSSLQIYHYGGEARVEAFSEPKHELMEGHVVMEDQVLLPAPESGFYLTDCLSGTYSQAIV
jgi:hypothetical protein